MADMGDAGDAGDAEVGYWSAGEDEEGEIFETPVPASSALASAKQTPAHIFSEDGRGLAAFVYVKAAPRDWRLMSCADDHLPDAFQTTASAASYAAFLYNIAVERRGPGTVTTVFHSKHQKRRPLRSGSLVMDTSLDTCCTRVGVVLTGQYIPKTRSYDKFRTVTVAWIAGVPDRATADFIEARYSPEFLAPLVLLPGRKHPDWVREGHANLCMYLESTSRFANRPLPVLDDWNEERPAPVRQDHHSRRLFTTALVRSSGPRRRTMRGGPRRRAYGRR